MLILYKNLKFVALLIIMIVVIGCVHKPDIQQGNVITEEMISQLKVGMPQNQVKGIIGKPLILDPFRENRWDYVYSMAYNNRKSSQHSYVTLYFEEQKLSEIKVHKQPLKENDIRSMEMRIKKRF